MSELSKQSSSLARPARAVRPSFASRLRAAWLVLMGGGEAVSENVAEDRAVRVEGGGTPSGEQRPATSGHGDEESARTLGDADARYRTLVASITDGLAILDRDWRCSFISDQGAAIIGTQASDLVGENIWKQFPEGVGSKFYQAFHRAMATGEVVHVEDNCPAPLDKWLECHCYPSVAGLSVLFRDVSDRKRVEIELADAQLASERQRRHYEAILTNTPDLAYIFSLDYRIIYANEVLLKMWGKPASEAIGRHLLELGYEPWHAEMHEREIDQVTRTKQPVRGQVYFNGTFGRRLYDYILVPVLNKAGEVEAVAGTTRDVTESELAATELRLERERLDFALHAAEMGQWSLNVGDLTAERTLRHDQIFGYAEHLPSWKYDDFLSHVVPADREWVDARFQSALRGESPWDIECRIRRVDGVERWIWTTGRIRRDPGGKALQMLGLVADITERKHAQLDLKLGMERLRLATEAAELGIWVWDVEADEVIWVNDRPYEILGLPLGSGAVNAARFRSEFLCEGEAEQLAAAVAKAIDSGERLYFRGRMRRSDGQIRWCELTGAIVPGGSDGRVRMHGTFEDVTDEVLAQQRAQQVAEALRIEQERLDFALKAAELGQWSLDLVDLTAERTLRHDQIFGYSELQPTWHHDVFRSHVVPADRPFVDARVESALRGEGDLEFECRIKRVDGQERWIWSKARIQRDSGGKPTKMLGLVADITERKRVQLELQTGMERVRLAAEAAELGIWEWDIGADEVVWVNDRPYEIFGLPAGSGAVNAARFRAEFLCEGEAARMDAAVDAAIQTRERLYFRGRMRRADGKIRWFEMTGGIVPDEKDGRVRMHGTFEDVTAEVVAQEHAERAAEANAKLRAMFDQGTQFSGILSIDGRVIEANRLAVESCGLKREEVIGRPFWECGWWSRSPKLVELVREATRGAAEGRPFRSETEYFVADGTERYIDLTVTPVTDDSGRVVFIASSGTDVTERKRAEQAVRESEERFRLMADAAPVLIWVSGVDMRPVWFNRTWLEFVGRSMAQELDGWRANVHPEDLEACMRTYAGAFERREPFSMDYRMRRHDGQYRWILDTGVPRHSQDGRFAGFIGSCKDVTERRNAQMELEQRVEQRTRELTLAHERLRMSERMASMGTLSAGLGHDMGNLLVPIRVRLSLLEEAELGTNVREDVAAIRTCVQYLQNLASGLRLLALDPMRAPTGSSTEFGAWWTEAEGVMRSVLPRGVAVQASFEPGQRRVRISAAALTQVVFNLVQNAGDAMRERASGTVKVRGWFEGPVALLSVSDDGPGMTDEVKSHCMEPFFSTKPRGISTGLGLALVHGLIKESGGTVELVTAPGQGAHFTLRLAAVDPESETGPRAGEVAVVDVRDDRLSAFVSAELRSRQFEVLHTADGSTTPPSVVVVDEEAKALLAPADAAILLLGAPAPGSSRPVRSTGHQPKASAVRDALRAILDERSRGGASEGVSHSGAAATRQDPQ